MITVLKSLGKGVLVALLIVGAYVVGRFYSPEFGPANSHQPTRVVEAGLTAPAAAAPPAPAGVARSRQSAITRAVAKVSPAVVGINVTQIREVTPWNPFFEDPFFRPFLPRYQQLVKSLGSGFIISRDGYIVTNEHVVHNAAEVVVTLPGGERHPAKIVGADYVTDLALLKIDVKHDLPYAEMGNSDDIIIGEWVIALGNPFGLFEINAEPIVTVGVVSAVNQDFGRQVSDRVYQDMIQTDAAVNGGNSGGPLVNSLGEVIGVNTWIISGSQNTTANIGLNFAIPINRVKRIIRDLKQYGAVNRRFWTGLEVDNLNPLVARFLGIRRTDGVIVTNVEKGSPAQRAGIRAGDVITAINGQPVHNTDDVWAVIENEDAKVGDILKLKIYRSGRTFTTDLRLEEPPAR